MREFLWRHRSLLLRGSFCIVLMVVSVGMRSHRTPGSDADGRIQYYQARIGGPATYPAYARLGAAYLQKARETGQAEYYDQAERHLEQSLRYQRNFEAARWLAAAYSARHKFQQALPYAREALSAMPSDVESQAALFDAYLGLGDRDSAAATLTGMLDQGPSFTADTRLAALRQKEGDFEEAIKAMERARQAAEASRAPAETRAWCHVERGYLHFQKGEPERAVAYYERALEILPGYHHALKHLAELRLASSGIARASEPN